MDKAYYIRRVKKGDESILAQIQTTSWFHGFQHIPKEEDLLRFTDLEKATNMYSNLLERNQSNGYILYVDKLPHGIMFWDTAIGQEDHRVAEIICVHSLCSNWGKGYGSVMMEFLIETIKSKGYKKIILWVFDTNERAIALYNKYDFYKTDKTKSFLYTTEVCFENTNF